MLDANTGEIIDVDEIEEVEVVEPAQPVAEETVVDEPAPKKANKKAEKEEPAEAEEPTQMEIA